MFITWLIGTLERNRYISYDIHIHFRDSTLETITQDDTIVTSSTGMVSQILPLKRCTKHHTPAPLQVYLKTNKMDSSPNMQNLHMLHFHPYHLHLSQTPLILQTTITISNAYEKDWNHSSDANSSHKGGIGYNWTRNISTC